MLKKISEYKLVILFTVLITLIYFALRLPNLTLQPVFADEAIYIRWAQVMKAEPTLRFLPSSDGKTPLFMWVMAPFFKIFSDPLFAGRLLSVISGFITLTGAFFLGWKFFNIRVGLWAGLLIAVTPFIVFFDRMALVDSMLAAFSLWSLILALFLIKHPRLDLSMFLGYTLGGGLLTKPPGMFSLISLPVTLAMFKWSGADRQWRLLKIFGLWAITFVITMVIYNILRLGPGFSGLSSRNQDYIFSPLELVGRPFDPFIPHLHDLLDWFPKLLTIPVLLLMIFSMAWIFFKRNLVAITILAWAFVPLIIEMFFLRTFTARYILFSVPPLLVLCAFGLDEIVSRVKLKFTVTVALSILLLFFSLMFDIPLINNPASVPLPRSERSGYLEEWTAGYGLKEIANFLMTEAEKGTIVVGTEGSFGTLPDGISIYLDNYFHTSPEDKKILVIGGKNEITETLRDSANYQPTYFIANKSRFLGAKNIELIKEYPKAIKPDGTSDAILFFKVLP